MTLRALCLSHDDLGELTRALAEAGLPFEDLEEPGRTFFMLEDGADVIGYGGWEGRSSDRLLRSLVIKPAFQGRGYGRLALAEIEAQAQRAGAAKLHLLTTTAAQFFRRNGYHVADRSSAPESIRASKEFSSLCPASATYMIKDL